MTHTSARVAFSPSGQWVLAVAKPAAPASPPVANSEAPATQPELKTVQADKPLPDLPQAPEGKKQLYLLDRDGAGGWRLLHQADAPMDIQQLNVSADGRTVAFIEYDEGKTDEPKRPESGRLLVLDVPSGKVVCERDLMKLSAAATQPASLRDGG